MEGEHGGRAWREIMKIMEETKGFSKKKKKKI